MKVSGARFVKPNNNQRKQQQSISQFFSPKRETQTNGHSSPLGQLRDSSSVVDAEVDERQSIEEAQCSISRKRSTDDGEDETVGSRAPALKKRKSYSTEGERSAFFSNHNGVASDKNSQLVNGYENVNYRSDEARHKHNNAAASFDVPSRSKPGSRTSRFIFSNPPVTVQNHVDNEETSEARQQRVQLHRRFVQKLGRPDSFADLKRRNRLISEESQSGEAIADNDKEDEDEDVDLRDSSTKGRASGGKKGSNKLTPMERQILDIKAEHNDTLLIVEVGYKFRFFGEDARTAAKELGIVCIPGKYRYDERRSQLPSPTITSLNLSVC